MASLLVNHFVKQKNIVLGNMANLQAMQTRNTFILKRKEPVALHKKGGKPKLHPRNFIYDLIEDTTVKKQPDINVILTKYVEGVGNTGDVISLRPQLAYRDLLMPGLAVYATPNNEEKFKSSYVEKKEEEYSSPYAKQIVNTLSRLVLQITMNKTVPWTLEKWHVRACFRKAGYVVPEYAIELPSQQISGPDLSLQDKEFVIVVTINNKEKANVRCRIHHWARGIDRLPWLQDHWKDPREPLFPEQAEVLASLPLSS